MEWNFLLRSFTNIHSGCLTQFVGSLDRPWASFALAVEQLLHMVRSTEGIESVLRSLDGHLSEAIMQAMQNGPHLEKKVRSAPYISPHAPLHRMGAGGGNPSICRKSANDSSLIYGRGGG